MVQLQSKHVWWRCSAMSSCCRVCQVNLRDLTIRLRLRGCCLSPLSLRTYPCKNDSSFYMSSGALLIDDAIPICARCMYSCPTRAVCAQEKGPTFASNPTTGTRARVCVCVSHPGSKGSPPFTFSPPPRPFFCKKQGSGAGLQSST